MDVMSLTLLQCKLPSIVTMDRPLGSLTWPVLIHSYWKRDVEPGTTGSSQYDLFGFFTHSFSDGLCIWSDYHLAKYSLLSKIFSLWPLHQYLMLLAWDGIGKVCSKHANYNELTNKHFFFAN